MLVRFYTLVVGVMLLACDACELTSHDLDAFQTTATGPSKIRAVLKDIERDPKLRARAALLLLDLDRRDLHGPEELQRELAGLTPESIERVATPLFKALLARMETQVGQAPSAAALRAKNAAERVLPLLREKRRGVLGDSLIRWVVRDVAKRADAGEHSIEELSDELAAGAAQPLLAGLQSHTHPNDLVRLSLLLDKHAPATLREPIAARLLDIAQTLDPLLPLLPALGHFADQAGVRALLVTTASNKARPTAERAEALTLLAGKATAAELLPMLGLALDEQESIALRELSVERAGETRSSEALPGLLMLLGDRTHARLRMLAGVQVLELGGPKILATFFRALPHSWEVPYSRAEIESYSERMQRFKPDTALLMLLGEKLHSSLWWPRVLALRYFAARGSAEDLWRLRKHEGDTAPIVGEGWPRAYSVGQEASVCVNALNERLLRAR